MKIVVTQSIEADTAYLAFGDEREVAETIAPLEDISIDLDAEGRIVGIEFVTASRVLPESALHEAEKDELIGVTAIAALFGRRKQNVAQHYTRRPDFPRPAAELPTGRYWRRSDVEEWWEHSDVGRTQRSEDEARATAAEWLTSSLAGGGLPIEEIRQRSADAGLSWDVVRQAADAIEVHEQRTNDDRSWTLPAGHPSLRDQ